MADFNPLGSKSSQNKNQLVTGKEYRKLTALEEEDIIL
jgi:hypothetical protein